ncbi:ABC transporter substrate-binding protein [Geobacillus sp. YHL]|uniref:ABC transporter substrate-binding protein n=1 Tax=Geobacillus sp. YHL TaxID=2796117 RepID=UPI001EF0567E|nr:ABC transporter substrate-binding protein [Geobacillus sp. YHL]MCG6796514.1 ABC transporter substrate-binding protein [Geobacillus sp. YHL]
MVMVNTYREKKYHLVSMFAIILLLVLISGCGQTTSAPQKGKDTSDKMDEIDITVTHYPTGLYAVPYNVGIEKGFFEEEGIKIKTIMGSNGGGTTVRNVLSGKLPFGEVSTAAAIQSYLAGAPIKIIGGGVQSVNDIVYLTRKDASFNKPEDFIGHKWGYTSPGSVTETVSQLIFKSLGIDKEKVKMVATGGINEGLTLLEKGEVDSSLMLDPAYSVDKDKWKTLFRVSEYVPHFQQSVIVTSPQIIKENPDLVERFLKAYRKSVEWVYNNPEEAAKIFAKSAEINDSASVEAVKAMASIKHWSSSIQEESLKQVLIGMQSVGTLKNPEDIDWSELLDQRFLPENERLNIEKLK